MQGKINLKKRISLFIASILMIFTIFSTMSSADEAYIASFNILRLGASEIDKVLILGNIIFHLLVLVHQNIKNILDMCTKKIRLNL